MPTLPGALVLGANLRALAVARSLGRHGIAVWLVAEPDEDRVARASRYARRTLSGPPAGSGERWCEALISAAATHRLEGFTIFPTGDEAAAALSKARERLATSFTFTSPSWEVARQAHHKRLSYELAERAGVERPWTRYPRSLAEVAALHPPFPVVLKPEVKERENAFTRAKAWRVEDKEALLRRWQEAAEMVGADAVMVQELIPAGGHPQYSYAALCEQGEVLAWLVARRTRQYPRDFGHSSCLVETVAAPAVQERGRAIVAALRWSGLIEVEMMHDVRDRSYKLLDINGRVWTWHGLGARAGVDFPYLAWRLAQGLPVDRKNARPGVRWVRLATDLPSGFGALRAGELSPSDWWASLRRPRVGAVFALDDPLPALLDPALLALRSARRRRRSPAQVAATAELNGRRPRPAGAP